MNAKKVIFLLLPLFSVLIGWGQNTVLSSDTTIYYTEYIEITGYQTPLIETTKRQKRSAEKFKKRLSELPPIQYTQKEMADYDKIKNGLWMVSNRKSDTSVFEPQWRKCLIKEIIYPEEAKNREIEDTIIIDFRIIDNQYIQNPTLVKGENQLLILTVFYAFDNIPALRLDNYDLNYSDSGKLRIGIYFKIPNKNL